MNKIFFFNLILIFNKQKVIQPEICFFDHRAECIEALNNILTRISQNLKVFE